MTRTLDSWLSSPVMGDVGPDDPTQLAAVDDSTRSERAWGLDDVVDYPMTAPTRRLATPSRITALAVGASLVLAVGSAALVGYLFHAGEPVSQPPTSVLIPHPSTPPAPLPASPAPAPAPIPATSNYTTFVTWVGTPCIEIRFPDEGTMRTQRSCSGDGVQIITHAAQPGRLIGADPVMGDASAIACQVVSDATGVALITDSGSAGDGHDVKCLMGAP